MRLFHRLRALLALAILVASVSVVTTDFAEARRGGSFGSRGGRTFSSPAATRTAPEAAAPVNRSMTPRQQTAPAGTPGAATTPGRRGLFGGLAGGLLGGLMLGGLVGMLMGHGIGGAAGMLGLLLQVGLLVLVLVLAVRLFRSARAGAPALAGSSGRVDIDSLTPHGPTGNTAGAGGPPREADAPAPRAGPVAGPPAAAGDEIGLTADDYDAFEQLLTEVQACFTREDYAGLRERCTPEIVSFLSEELSQNAVGGVRNEVTQVRLVEGDLAEAWREGTQEYATVAMRYASIDVLRDRTTGQIVSGEAQPTETVEIWTFVRPAGGAWKLSAIQEA